MKHGQKCGHKETLKNDVLFGDKVTVVTRNWENIHFLTIFYNISDIIHSRVMILHQKVACGKTFKMMWHWMALTFGQGHNIENLENINFWKYMYLRFYSQ